jgi:hypothetical protein
MTISFDFEKEESSMRKRRKSISTGDIFFPREKPDLFNRSHTHRRILGIIGDARLYSTGGDTNCACQLKTLPRWGMRRGEKRE